MSNSIKARIARLQAIAAQKQEGAALMTLLENGAWAACRAPQSLQRCSRRNRQHEIIYQTANVLSLSTFKKNSAIAHKKERKFIMDFKANIETRESVEAKGKGRFRL